MDASTTQTFRAGPRPRPDGGIDVVAINRPLNPPVYSTVRILSAVRTALLRPVSLTVLVACLSPLAAPRAHSEEAAPTQGASEAAELQKSDALYRSAQRAFQRQAYEEALALFQEYLEWGKSHAHRRERVFWSLDRIGAIYLRFQRRPDLVIAFFERARQDPRLNEVERDTISEWVEVARTWQEADPPPIKNPKLLFERAKRYYDAGQVKLDSPLGFAAHADFNIAAGYLLPFIIHYDRDPHLPQALLMMGIIRRHSHLDTEYWSDNFYLKEVIRRFPHTETAARAWTELRKEVLSAHSEAGQKTLPPLQEEMLEVFGEVADPAKRGADPLEEP